MQYGIFNVVRIAGLALFCLAQPLLAQTQPAQPSAAEAALKRPSAFRSRIEIRDEYQDLGEGSYRNLIIPRFEYAVNPDVALRLETPYVTDKSRPGAASVSGQGDLLARGAWRPIERDGFALIVATDVIFDTADDERLGSGKTIVAPQVYAAIDTHAFDSVFFPSIQHYQSVAGQGNRANVNTTVIKPNLLTRWPNRVYTFFEPQFTIDWERNAKTGLTLELEVGKILSANVAAWIRPGVGAINRYEVKSVYNWNLEVGMRYIF